MQTNDKMKINSEALKNIKRPPILNEKTKAQDGEGASVMSPTYVIRPTKISWPSLAILTAIAGGIAYAFTTFTTYHYVDQQNTSVVKAIDEMKVELKTSQNETKELIKETNKMLMKIMSRSKDRGGD